MRCLSVMRGVPPFGSTCLELGKVAKACERGATSRIDFGGLVPLAFFNQ